MKTRSPNGSTNGPTEPSSKLNSKPKVPLSAKMDLQLELPGIHLGSGLVSPGVNWAMENPKYNLLWIFMPFGWIPSFYLVRAAQLCTSCQWVSTDVSGFLYPGEDAWQLMMAFHPPANPWFRRVPRAMRQDRIGCSTSPPRRSSGDFFAKMLSLSELPGNTVQIEKRHLDLQTSQTCTMTQTCNQFSWGIFCEVSLFSLLKQPMLRLLLTPSNLQTSKSYNFRFVVHEVIQRHLKSFPGL